MYCCCLLHDLRPNGPNPWNILQHYLSTKRVPGPLNPWTNILCNEHYCDPNWEYASHKSLRPALCPSSTRNTHHHTCNSALRSRRYLNCAPSPNEFPVRVYLHLR